jgi:serine phosphatase RsbU (regulator of sigma subunit)
MTGPVRITLALGGHPQPLLRRRDGTVSSVGHPGTALGLIRDIDVRT